MEKFELDRDIHLLGVQAASFPDGISAAYQKLTSTEGAAFFRSYYGISYGSEEGIVYFASGEPVNNQGIIPKGCTTYTLKKGTYISRYLPDFTTDISQVGKVFEELLSHPDLDAKGCCAECYFPEGVAVENAKDIRCMVRLSD
jgi:hypothetical protein